MPRDENGLCASAWLGVVLLPVIAGIKPRHGDHVVGRSLLTL